MSLGRLWTPALASLSLSLLAMALSLLAMGCQAPPRLDPLLEEDGFGIESGEINEQTLKEADMLHQRGQLEFKFAGSFPWDVFDPTEDPLTDPAVALGTKFDFEVEKNLFLGFSFDWVRHEVEDPSSPADTQPVQFMDKYDRYAFLGNLDYDIPVGDDELPLFLRIGGGIGLLVIQPDDRFSGPQRVETTYNIVFRPSLGLRAPLSETLVLFLEGSYDIVPRRTLTTLEDDRISGEDPIYGSGMIWLGLAFQWH